MHEVVRPPNLKRILATTFLGVIIVCLLCFAFGLISGDVVLLVCYAMYVALVGLVAFLSKRIALTSSGRALVTLAYKEVGRWLLFVLLALSGAPLFIFWKSTLLTILAVSFIVGSLSVVFERRHRKAMRYLRDNPPGGSAPALVPAGPIKPRRTGSTALEMPTEHDDG